MTTSYALTCWSCWTAPLCLSMSLSFCPWTVSNEAYCIRTDLLVVSEARASSTSCVSNSHRLVLPHSRRELAVIGSSWSSFSRLFSVNIPPTWSPLQESRVTSSDTKSFDFDDGKHFRRVTCRKYQELTMQIEQENLQRAKEILERRKSERDRLNAYIHSVGDPQAKHSEHFRGMRRPNTEGMFGRPPWTASLRNDYETLIKLREKEIAVATLRLKNHKQLPNHILMDSEARGIDDASGRDESSFL